jgi:hypothetical protein
LAPNTFFGATVPLWLLMRCLRATRRRQQANKSRGGLPLHRGHPTSVESEEADGFARVNFPHRTKVTMLTLAQSPYLSG